MTALLHFRMGDGEWAVDVEHVRRVVRAGRLHPLPSPLPGVAGLLESAEEPSPLPVLAPARQTSSRHVIVLAVGGRRFGLLVAEVVGVLGEHAVRMGPAPAGQHHRLVGATADTPDGTALVLDAEALAGRLEATG